MIQNKNIVIGITGASGSGKSTVCNFIIENYNAIKIDADKIGHLIIKNGEKAYNEIVEYFGHSVTNENGEINRKILGEIVFSDKKKLEKLSSITHKYIAKKILGDIKKYRELNIYDYILVDAPLLIEANLHTKVNEIWIVYANLDIRINRLMKRDNLSEKNIRNRLERQSKFDDMKKYANFIIYNNEDDILNIIKKKLKEL